MTRLEDLQPTAAVRGILEEPIILYFARVRCGCEERFQNDRELTQFLTHFHI